MFLKMTKRMILLSAMVSFGTLVGCGEDGSSTVAEQVVSETELFKEFSKFDVDADAKTITLKSAADSLVVGSLASLGGASYYLALDEDLFDPEIDWDNELVEGSVISLKGSETTNIVVMDDASRVLCVWQIILPATKPESSSSSKENVTPESSSSVVLDPAPESSSSVETDSTKTDSSTVVTSSSSVENAVESSSSEVSSSGVESSSSENGESSSSEAFDIKTLKIEGATLDFRTDDSIYVELEYGSDLAKVSILEKEYDLRDWTAIEIEGEAYLFKAGVQLPGSDFSARNDFWATTSDAMSESVWKCLINVYSEENLAFENGMATITSKIVYGSAVGQKLVSGYYYAGSFTGENALYFYQADLGCTGLGSSNFTGYMEHGKAFAGRPQSFELTYSYNHVDNKDGEHPQMGLAYVFLVSADKKVVATGAIFMNESVSNVKKTVVLEYGKDPNNFFDGKKTFAVDYDLTMGNGEEDVAYIHVMFASSAHGHVASHTSGSWRGGEGSELIVDDFKLVY